MTSEYNILAETWALRVKLANAQKFEQAFILKKPATAYGLVNCCNESFLWRRQVNF